MTRWDKQKLESVTGRKTPGGQKKWFLETLGANVPCDSMGPVMNERTYDALLMKSCGMMPAPEKGGSKKEPKLRI